MNNDHLYTWHQVAVGDESLVAQGSIITLQLGEKEVCITNTQGHYFAFASTCPHAGAQLQHGWLADEYCVVCPLHQYAFDIRTGRNTTDQGYHLMRYPVKHTEHGVWIGLRNTL